MKKVCASGVAGMGGPVAAAGSWCQGRKLVRIIVGGMGSVLCNRGRDVCSRGRVVDEVVRKRKMVR